MTIDTKGVGMPVDIPEYPMLPHNGMNYDQRSDSASQNIQGGLKQVELTYTGGKWYVNYHRTRTEAAVEITTRHTNGEVVYVPDFKARFLMCDAGNVYFDLPHAVWVWEQAVAGQVLSVFATKLWLGAETTVTRIHIYG